jgi:hypothetical protein
MPELGVTTEQVAQGAAEWAEEAGKPADVPAIALALAECPGPFGEGVDALMAALGFRFGGGESPSG